MNDPRFDARVRAALLDVPMPDDDETRVALGKVTGRSRGGGGWSPWLVGAAAAAAVLVLILATVLAVPRSGQEPPASPASSNSSSSGSTLLDTPWVRRVDGGIEPTWAGRWTATFNASGSLTLEAPTGAEQVSDAAAFTVADSTVRISAFTNTVCPGDAAGVYRWTGADGRLTLSPVTDSCLARRAVLAGTWQDLR